MAELITGPLAAALERGRERYNVAFILARRANRRLDPRELGDHLKTLVDPMVRAVDAVAPQSVDTVTQALFDLSLELMGQDYLGPTPRFPDIIRFWRDLLPRAPVLLAQNPARLAGAISNAGYNLSRQETGNSDLWLKIMVAAVPLCSDLELYLKVGQVAAWRCGLAQFRSSSLEIWQTLPDPLARIALGFKPDADVLVKTDLTELLTDPWRHPKHAGKKPDRTLRLVAKVGGFRGFGQEFVTPPEVTTAKGVLYAFDREFCYSLYADCFGAVTERYGPDLPAEVENRPGGFTIKQNGTVTKSGQSTTFPELARASSYAATEHTLAVTVAHSYKVYLVALADPT